MDCPVCQSKYVKGKVQRCHVCGWELSPSCLSMVGPLRIEHQISMSSLEKIQAWAHYMWSTQQAQKEEVAKLQRQLKNAQREGESSRVQLEQFRSQPRFAPQSSPIPPPEANIASNLSPSATLPLDRIPPEGREVWEWLLQRFTQAEKERSQLQAQLAQLQGADGSSSRQMPREIEPESPRVLEQSPSILPPEQMRDLELLRLELQSRASLQLSQFQAVERLKEQFQQQIETVTAQIQQVSEERDRLHSQLREQQAEFARKQQAWQEGQAALTERCDRLESQLSQQQTQIQQLKTEHCDRLESQLGQQQSQIQQLQAENTGLQTTIADRDRILDEQGREQREHLESINREQQERDRQQSSLNEQLRQLRKSWQSHLTQQQTLWQQKRKEEEEEHQSELAVRQTHLHDQITRILARCDALESGLENLQPALRGIPRTASGGVKRGNPPVYTKYK